MSYTYITSGATTQVYTSTLPNNQTINKVRIVVNTALTGTIKVIDGTSGTTANVATITNPTVGQVYEYWGLQNGVRIVTSTTCDITVLVSASPGRH